MIAIPTHNRRDTVLLAARSALGQTRPPDQLLVLCDGCSDGTADALRGLGAAQLEAIELPKGIGVRRSTYGSGPGAHGPSMTRAWSSTPAGSPESSTRPDEN